MGAHSADGISNHLAKGGGGDDFDIGAKGEDERDKLVVDLHVDGDLGEARFLRNNALREVQGLGFDVVETVVGNAQDNIHRLVALGNGDANDIVEIMIEIHLGLLIRQRHLLETLDTV